jgi:TonB-linked SusC/RagA family outer membrane protein
MKTKKRLLLMLLSLLVCNIALHAQVKKAVTGIVKDTAGVTLTGATVTEKGTTNRVMTNQDGKFTIKVDPSATLQITYAGFAAKNVSASDRNLMDITMDGGNKALTEVVVTSLGITRKQKALGYAVSTIKAESITQAGTPNFATALYGKAPGVTIAAAPGGSTSAVNITVRGINSITGKNQALIVMDGVPIRDGEVSNNNYWGDQRIRGNGLLDLNPEDIENISILKGASAAALYGAEAVNGVVLITTKKGKGKGFRVDVSANASVDNVAYLPKFQSVRGPGSPIHVANDGQDADLFYYETVNGVRTRAVVNRTISFGPKFDGQPTLAWDGVMRPYVAQNNYKNFFQTAHNSSVTAAIANSSEVADVRLSLTHQTTQGVSLGSENYRNVANFNSTFRLNKKFTTDLTINYINQHIQNRPYATDRLINNFTGMISPFDNPDWYLNKYKTSLGYHYVTGNNQTLTPAENIIYKGFRGDVADFIWNVKENKTDEYSNRVIGSLTNNWQIINNLKLRTRVATDFTSMKEEDRSTSSIPLLYGYSGGFGLNSTINSILYGDALLTYTQKINNDIEVNLMGGYTATKEEGSYINSSTNGGLTTENNFDLSASVNKANVSIYRRTVVKDAFLGTLNASYKNYLFLEGTLRRDRTSTLNPGNNSFIYPSVNSSFILSEAFKLPEVISYAKIRAAAGIVGNYADPYSASIAYNQGNLGSQQNGGSSVIYTNMGSSYGNEKLRPEEKHEIEVGLESKFLKNRISLELSYYVAKTVDQILPLTLPTNSGASSIMTNIGTLKNTGLEVGISATAISTRNFKWDVGLNLAQNTNKVVALANGATELLHADFDGNAAQLKSVVGQSMGDFYAHPIAKDSKGQGVVGDDGLYALDPGMVKIGNAMPKVIGGFTNNFSYKGFSLDMMIDYRLGGYVMPTGLNWMTSRGLTEESLNAMDKAHGGISYYVDANGKGVQTSASAGPTGQQVFNDGMLLSGVNSDGQPNTNVVSQAYYYWNVYNWGGPQYSESRYELYIKKNSYVKFREVSLSYRIPKNIAGKIGAKNLTLSVFGRNLFYLYRTIKDMDAEQLTAGSRWFQSLNNAGSNPSTRTFGVMLRASF